MNRSALHLAVLGLGLLGLSARIDMDLVGSVVRRPYDVRYIPRGDVARVAALGQRLLLSDLYWLASVQYIGEPQADQRGWKKLYPLVDLVTDLDPRHGYAYQTAGITLGAANRIDESNGILLKGMNSGPDWWTYPFYIAFNYWFYQGDYETGARYAAMAAELPGVGSSMRHLALSLASKAGNPEEALPFLRELRESIQDPKSAEAIDGEIKLAELERDAQALERAASIYKERMGKPIQSLQDLVEAGIVPGIPPDPFGGVYRWDPDRMQVVSTANSFRFKQKEGAHTPGFNYQPSKKEMEAMP